jgi:hypothetical protein
MVKSRKMRVIEEMRRRVGGGKKSAKRPSYDGNKNLH